MFSLPHKLSTSRDLWWNRNITFLTELRLFSVEIVGAGWDKLGNICIVLNLGKTATRTWYISLVPAFYLIVELSLNNQTVCFKMFKMFYLESCFSYKLFVLTPKRSPKQLNVSCLLSVASRWPCYRRSVTFLCVQFLESGHILVNQ